jgi:peptide deformylase
MAIRPIVRYPDPRLETPAAPVTAFDDHLAALVADLTDTLIAAPAIGLTAPHIGVSAQVTVIKLAPDQPARVFVNPTVVSTSGPPARHREGSVSMPGIEEEVERPSRATIRYQVLDGTVFEDTFDGWPAIVLQHEIDQLNGLFWIHRLSRLKRERLVKKWGKRG